MSRDTPYACPLRSDRGDARPEEQILQVILEESDLRIVFSARADHEFMRDSLVSYIAKLRGEITLWMTLYPEFRSSLLPLPLPDKAPALVTAMYAAAQAMHVGPFAAVAGAIAQAAAEHTHQLLINGGLPGDVIVENGGDVFIISEVERVAALLPDPENASELGILLKADDMPLGLCSSSGLIGHSLSFGHGNLATVRARNCALADAAATAYGNMLKNKKSVSLVLEQAERDQRKGIEGVFVQCEEQIGIWGNMELVPLSA